MVINNPYYIKNEIKKPAETVYEIKEDYKVPSFEEFMKTYEVDENLNYDDLSSGSVGEVKGYGPCYEKCGWNNPYCSYQEWMELYTSCPASGCTNTTITSWLHEVGGGTLEVSDHANIRCKKCGTATHASKWPFPACSNHRGVPKKVTYDSFTKALNLVFKVQENKKVAKRLFQHLFYHEDEWEN